MSDQNQTLENLYQFENFPERSYLTGYKIDYYTDFKGFIRIYVNHAHVNAGDGCWRRLCW